jgi:hypothetical protein
MCAPLVAFLHRNTACSGASHDMEIDHSASRSGSRFLKDENKALEAQAEELVQQAKDLEKSGQLVEARKRYASSQAFWETKDAEKAFRHIDDEINKKIKDALQQAHQLYDQGRPSRCWTMRYSWTVPAR